MGTVAEGADEDDEEEADVELEEDLEDDLACTAAQELEGIVCRASSR